MTVPAAPAEPPSTGPDRAREARRGAIHRRLTVGLQIVLVIGAVLSLTQGRWLPALTTLAIVGLTILPFAVGRRLQIFVPPEFEVLAVIFIYASLFLGEVRGYYVRFWWWDALLHTGSGFLLGMWDLIVDGIGALAISVFGWSYLRKAGTDSFLER